MVSIRRMGSALQIGRGEAVGCAWSPLDTPWVLGRACCQTLAPLRERSGSIRLTSP